MSSGQVLGSTDINGGAEKFVHACEMWERGRSDGIALAIQIVEQLLCHKETTEGQRKILVGLYDSLLEAKTLPTYL
jgi:hypothetical protein